MDRICSVKQVSSPPKSTSYSRKKKKFCMIKGKLSMSKSLIRKTNKKKSRSKMKMMMISISKRSTKSRKSRLLSKIRSTVKAKKPEYSHLQGSKVEKIS